MDRCINPDYLASTIEALKERLPDLQGARVDLHPSGFQCYVADKHRDKRLVCSLQELERCLPPRNRLVVSQIDSHGDLDKRWRSVRRGWWIGTVGGG